MVFITYKNKGAYDSLINLLLLMGLYSLVALSILLYIKKNLKWLFSVLISLAFIFKAVISYFELGKLNL